MNAEEMIKEYPKMKKELALLASQIESFQGLTEDDVIEMMLFRGRDYTERVQTSSVSDITAQIAIKYKEVMDRENREWYRFLLDRFWELKGEIDFFEQSVKLLPDELADMMGKILFEGYTWEQLEGDLYIGHTTVAKRRKKAIRLLNEAYDIRYQTESEFICS